jgi:hypothetical protein
MTGLLKRLVGPRVARGRRRGRGWFPVLAVLREGGGVHASLRLVDYHGTPAVLKDYGKCRWPFRVTCGAFLCRRESAAYRRVGHIASVPRFLGRVGIHGLLLEYVAGPNCREAPGRTFPPAFFDDLRAVLATVRARGVAHQDVKRNVLVSPAGRPVLIDFASSFVFPFGPRPWRRLLRRVVAPHDERAIVQLKTLLPPHKLTPDEQASLTRPLPLEGLILFCQELINGTLRRLTRQQPQPFPHPAPARGYGLQP